MALGAALIVLHRREHLAARGRQLAWWLACLGASGVCAFGVTVRVLTVDGSVGLKGEGQFPAFAPWQAVLLAVALLTAGVLLPDRQRPHRGGRSRRNWPRIGARRGPLLLQRTEPGVVLWGYYPKKLMWVLAVLWLVIVTQAVVSAASLNLRRRRDRVALPLVAAGTAAAMMLVLPPAASPMAGRGVLKVFWTATIVDGRTGTIRDDLGAVEGAFDLLPQLDRTGARIIYSRFVDDEIGEQWANDWSVRLAGVRGDPVSRASIGGPDLRRSTDVCVLAGTWHPQVTVLTGDARLRDDVAA
jgi:hypothetical protein